MERGAFLFPGQGSQYVGMGKDLFENFGVAKETFEEASDFLKIDMQRLCFEGPEDVLKQTENTQPSILTISITVLRVLLSETDVTPEVMAGHSLGEYSALVASGAMAFSDAVRVVRKRGKFMQEAVPEGQGAMAALIGDDREAVEELCRDLASDQVVSPANYNSPEQIVISGHKEAVEAVVEEAKQRGIKKAVMLPVSAPFHCSLMAPAGKKLSEVLNQLSFEEIKIPVISNVKADLYPSFKEIQRLLVAQVSQPVRWHESMVKAISMGVETSYELGPGKVLSGLMRRIDRNVSTYQVENVSTLKALLRVI